MFVRTSCWLLLSSLLSPLQAAEPLKNAHAHNDYWHQRPLVDALDHGFTSVEADICLVADKLLVGHELAELSPEKTLESLYLAPLERRVRENGGHVYRNGGRFFLLIDLKTDADATYRALEPLLTKYAEMLTTVDQGEVREGAVTIVLSGNRPSALLAKAPLRHAGLDGRLSDLDSNAPAHLVPMISDNWPTQFRWQGQGAMPAAERQKLADIVRQTHTANRVLRFWATPENEAVWRELRAAGVDLIGTDQLEQLGKFLREDVAAKRDAK